MSSATSRGSTRGGRRGSFSVAPERRVDRPAAVLKWHGTPSEGDTQPSSGSEPVHSEALSEMGLLSLTAWLRRVIEHEEPIATRPNSAKRPSGLRMSVTHGPNSTTHKHHRKSLDHDAECAGLLVPYPIPYAAPGSALLASMQRVQRPPSETEGEGEREGDTEGERESEKDAEPSEEVQVVTEHMRELEAQKEREAKPSIVFMLQQYITPSTIGEGQEEREGPPLTLRIEYSGVNTLSRTYPYRGWVIAAGEGEGDEGGEGVGEDGWERVGGDNEDWDSDYDCLSEAGGNESLDFPASISEYLVSRAAQRKREREKKGQPKSASSGSVSHSDDSLSAPVPRPKVSIFRVPGRVPGR
ncbi:hypothetical protein KIPB_009858 [Kipferlia bialata]|uniref:Uncharacterized protein n=1 Tax=Kipferlia bialata TaxID=797122 RepID=A0A9K3D4G0_9EUKA|nr:hypothetical protein KIPB_009858 [Kipferlia bialata]|eukprot:g9858.t1